MISDSDQSKINAETASQYRKKGEKLDVEQVILRAIKQDGVGLTPPEVWALVIEIERLYYIIEGFDGE